MPPTCAGCGAGVPAGAKFCPECGEGLGTGSPDRELRELRARVEALETWSEQARQDRERLAQTVKTAMRMLDNVIDIVAIELLAAAQGVEFHHPKTSSPAIVEVIAALRTAAGVERIEYAGSLRRFRETIGDIDILTSTSKPADLAEAFRTMDGVEKVINGINLKFDG